MGRFMARDYVTIREEQRGGETVWVQTSVGRALLKSVPAKVTRKNGQYRIVGAAWGAPIARVEVQIDGGSWVPATIDRSQAAEFAWVIWYLDWKSASPGEHAITSRAIDTLGKRFSGSSKGARRRERRARFDPTYCASALHQREQAASERPGRDCIRGGLPLK
jgi:hypothetical protein